jgi:hypothetical protein
MSYPSLEQYRDVMQYPHLVLADPELKNGKISKNNFDLPMALCGGFALTYTITTNGKKYAVRCFHKQSNELEKRYQAISNKLKVLHSSYFVDFEFQLNGISVNNKKFPVVKMSWASGKTLGEFLSANYRNKNDLQQLNTSFLNLASYLENQRIAHGDIQTGNVMVSNGGRSVQLIDYDGMFVEELKNLGSAELGQINFQHPQRASNTWDFRLDRFSFITLNFALRVLAVAPDLWGKTQSDENAILFKANDFSEPTQSAIFQVLFNRTEFSNDAKNFAAICKSPYEKVPTLEDFLSQKNIPQISISILPANSPAIAGYRSAYPVLDARNYSLCEKLVGDRVELIGQIVEVKQGDTIKGETYVFLNFGYWKGKIVKICIWPNVLVTLTQVPDESWVGKWISVVGLMEPPYESFRFGYVHLAISITQGNELHVITEKEAKFRLIGNQTPIASSTTAKGNKEVVDNIKRSIPDVDQRITPSSAWGIPTSPKQSATKPVLSTPATSTSSKLNPATPVSRTPVVPMPQKVSSATPNQSILSNMKSSKPAPSISKPQTQIHQTPPKLVAKATKSKPDGRLKVVIGCIVIVLITTFILFLLILADVTQIKVVSTPTRQPIATKTQKSTLPAPQIIPTKKNDCISWSEVNKLYEGKQTCVYGVVNSKRTFSENGIFSYTLIRFKEDLRTFYLISRNKSVTVKIGDCITVNSIMSYDKNFIPFMEITELDNGGNLCNK